MLNSLYEESEDAIDTLNLQDLGRDEKEEMEDGNDEECTEIEGVEGFEVKDLEEEVDDDKEVDEPSKERGTYLKKLKNKGISTNNMFPVLIFL